MMGGCWDYSEMTSSRRAFYIKSGCNASFSQKTAVTDRHAISPCVCEEISFACFGIQSLLTTSCAKL